MADLRRADEESRGNIKVVCRFRPINDKEAGLNAGNCVEFLPDGVTVGLVAGDSPGLKFTFDAVFSPTSLQSDVYETAARPTVESVLEGFNGTVFAYGQTGSGKTYTMTGPSIEDPEAKGVIPRMVETVFLAIQHASPDLEFTVKVGYAEIYMEKLKDLLEPDNLTLAIHEDKARGVYIAGLTEEYVSSPEEVYALMKLGQGNREVGATLMNEGSSRSHSLFLMTISQANKTDFSAKTGKLYLVDLAGSEKVGKTGAEGKRLDEAKKINKSLSTLGLVINSLTDGKSTHVPYRDSKLTRVLQDSLGGNSKTALIVTCSPSSYNEAETIGTLRFGIRAKNIRNKPKINREQSIAELKLLLAKAEASLLQRDSLIVILRKRLLEAGGTLPSDQEIANIQEEVEEEAKSDLSSNIEDLTIELDQLRAAVDSLRSEKAQLIETHAAESSRSRQEAEEGHFRVTQANMRISALVDQVKDLESEQGRLLAQKADLEEEVRRLGVNREEDMSRSIPATEAEKWKRVIEEKEREIEELRAGMAQRESVLMTIESATVEPAVRELCEAQRSLSTNIASSVMLEEEQARSRQLSEDNEQLRKELAAAIGGLLPDSETALACLTTAAINKEKQLWDQRLSLTQHDLANRVEKVILLEQDLDNMKETNEMLLSTLCKGDRGMQQYIRSLETVRHNLEIRCNRLGNERRELVESLKVAKEKVNRLEERLKEAEMNFEEAWKSVEELLAKERSESKPKHKSVKKVLKGGGLGRSSEEWVSEEGEEGA
jgi:kinesin family protein 5